jgi:hypothetical protein
MLSAIIERRPVVKYARNGPWRSAAKDVPVGEIDVRTVISAG